MVDYNFLDAIMEHLVYTHKEDTKSSFYSENGILPNRFSFQRCDFTKVTNVGRCSIEKKAGQLVGKFTKSENSPLKKYKPYTCRTEIFRCADFPLLIGYGTLGISESDGRVRNDNGDVVVLYSNDNLSTLHIFYFRNLKNPDYKWDILAFVNAYVRKNISEKRGEGENLPHKLDIK